MQHVYFNDNEIEALPADILKHNPKLEVLDLANNKLQNNTDTFGEILSIEEGKGKATNKLQVLNLRNNENLGRISDLYHNHASWYTQNGQIDTAMVNPFEQFKNRVSQVVQPGREESSVFDIMQRKMQLVDDLEL